MKFEQPKPDSKKYSDLISDIEKGIIKIPKFQREFVWSIDKTAKLLDSILKGYPIGTFIFWQTYERINDIKNVGNLKIPDTPEGTKVQYVLDGQQRITSLFAAYLGAQIQKTGEKFISLYDVLNFNYSKAKELSNKFSDDELETIDGYSTAFKTYEFSTVVLRKEDIDSAIEVFTRINTNRQTSR